jgi:hypothetical protein
VVVAIAGTAVVLYALDAAGGFTRDVLVELPPGGAWVVIGVGAVAGAAMGALSGRVRVHPALGYVARGALAGIALVALAAVAWTSGASPKLAAGPRAAFLVFGVPPGAVVGGVLGWVAWRRAPRSDPEPTPPATAGCTGSPSDAPGPRPPT